MENTLELTKKESQLLEMEVNEFGLEVTKAREIEAQFAPMLAKMSELEIEFNKVTNMPYELESTALMARELKRKYTTVRLGTAEIHKKQKAFYLNAGRFVDSWKNNQLLAAGENEKTLEYIENYNEIQKKKAEIAEAKKIKELIDSRTMQLVQFQISLNYTDLGKMSEDEFKEYFLDCQILHDAKIKAKKEAEELEAEQKRLTAIELEKTKAENEKLKAEIEAKERAEKLKVDNEAKEIRRVAKEQKKADLAPDKVKLTAFVGKIRPSFDSTINDIQAQALYVSINEKINEVVNWAKLEIEKL